MPLFIFAIIIAIVTVIVGTSFGAKKKDLLNSATQFADDYRRNAQDYTAKASRYGAMQRLVFAVGAVVVVLFIILSCVTTVPTGHTGVPVTFGRVESYTLDSGVHFIKPWQNVVKMDNRVQKKTVDLMCFSSDIQEVSMVYTINYQISKSDAMTIYSSIGTDYYETVVTPAMAEAVKIVAARYSAEELIGMRDELAQAIEADLAAKLSPYHIDVVATSIEDMDFSDAFTDAVEAKQVAQQNKLRAETEAEQKVIEAEAAAEVRKVEADASAYEILAQAEAEAEANEKLAASITDGLINYQYAQSWNGELPMFSSSGDGSMFPVFNMGDVGTGTNSGTTTPAQGYGNYGYTQPGTGN